MNNKLKNDIRAKAKLAYGLLNILKYDIDNLRIDVNDCNVDAVRKTLEDTNRTLENMIDVISEIEYIVFLHSTDFA